MGIENLIIIDICTPYHRFMKLQICEMYQCLNYEKSQQKSSKKVFIYFIVVSRVT